MTRGTSSASPVTDTRMDRQAAVRGLLIRGMLAGLAAGVLMFLFAKVFGEPSIDRAIAFEGDTGEAPLVSRTMQASLGLLTGTVVYGVAIGGVFALVFAAVHGRVGRARPRVTAATLALVCFAVIVLVPFLKYPSNPPAVGNDDTIGYRTQIYFAMMAISVAAALAALRLGRDTVKRFGAWNGTLPAVGAYIALIVISATLMPGLNEVPRGFDPDV